MKNLIVLAGCLGCLLLPKTALSVPVSFQYTTSLDASSIGLSSNEQFTVWYSIDTQAADLSSDPGFGYYGVSAAWFQLGSQPVFTWNGAPASTIAIVENNVPTDLYGLSLGGSFSGSSINGWTFANDGGFTLYDFGNSNWNSDALPTFASTLDSFQYTRAGLNFTQGANQVTLRLPGALQANGYFRHESEVAFSVVPEASLQAVWSGL